MRDLGSLGVRVYQLEAVDRYRWQDKHDTICRGQSPRPGRAREAAEPMDFHLALASAGEMLVLFREGYEPQAIRVNELVLQWLAAAGSVRVTEGSDDV